MDVHGELDGRHAGASGHGLEGRHTPLEPRREPEKTKEGVAQGYKLGRDATKEELPLVIRSFLRTEARVRQARIFTLALLEHFRYQGEFVFMGSSLLFAYDAALGDDAPLRISMIDFGHAHKMAEMRSEAVAEGRENEFEARDVGYIKGLTSLLEILGGEAVALTDAVLHGSATSPAVGGR